MSKTEDQVLSYQWNQGILYVIWNLFFSNIEIRKRNISWFRINEIKI